MKKEIIRRFILAVAGIFLASSIWSQGSRSSPAVTASGNVKGVTITIDYSSPAVRGRIIWGDLVPYDKVWRAGANEATLITIDKDVVVEGKALLAGTYSLYAIPRKTEWTIIFNSDTGQWGINHDGTTTEDPAKDVLRATVKPINYPEFNERLTYMVDVNGFSLFWENLKIPVSIR